MPFLLADDAATQALAGRIAALARRGDVILLEGGLGSGKTSFARGFLRALGVEEEVPSPTFTLVQSYALPGLDVTHSDLYRLADESEVVELGLDEAWCHGALLVEWPDRAPGLWPEERLAVRLELPPGSPGDARQVWLRGTGRWASLLDTLAGDECSR